VLNVTPDSFSDGGRFVSLDAALSQARTLLREGADVVDVGGESSRPAGKTYGDGAGAVTAEEELRRVLPVVEALAAEKAVVSVDTVKPEVARATLQAGASIVNDVSCGASDALLTVAAEAGAQLVLMHTRGRGEVAPPHTTYGDLVAEVLGELMTAVARAESLGVRRERIWIDPGIGFAKTAEQSVALLARTDAFVRAASGGMRVLVGPSRKSFIAETARDASGERPAPDARLGGTLAAVTAAALAGAHAVRVHDVFAARQAVRVADALREARA